MDREKLKSRPVDSSDIAWSTAITGWAIIGLSAVVGYKLGQRSVKCHCDITQ